MSLKRIRCEDEGSGEENVGTKRKVVKNDSMLKKNLEVMIPEDLIFSSGSGESIVEYLDYKALLVLGQTSKRFRKVAAEALMNDNVYPDNYLKNMKRQGRFAEEKSIAFVAACHFGHDTLVKCLLENKPNGLERNWPKGVFYSYNAGRTSTLSIFIDHCESCNNKANIKNFSSIVKLLFLQDNKYRMHTLPIHTLPTDIKIFSRLLQCCLKNDSEKESNTKVVKLLLYRAQEQSRTDILVHILKEHEDIVEMLTETTLHCLAVHCSLSMLKILVDHISIDINTLSMRGFTLLMRFVGKGDIDKVQYLLSLGSNVNAVCEQGDSAIFFVRNNVEMLKILLAAGADLELRNSRGENLLEKSRRLGSHDVVAYLTNLQQ